MRGGLDWAGRRCCGAQQGLGLRWLRWLCDSGGPLRCRGAAAQAGRRQRGLGLWCCCARVRAPGHFVVLRNICSAGRTDMGAAPSVRRRSSLPIPAPESADAEMELVNWRADEASRADETSGEQHDSGGRTPRSRSVLLNRAMTEALQRNDIDECASLGQQLIEVPVQWVTEENGEHTGRVQLSTVDKPNRAILAAVCNAKAVRFERTGLFHDARYARKLAAMFASSLGPAECQSKATVDSARDARELRMRSSRQPGHRRQSSGF